MKTTVRIFEKVVEFAGVPKIDGHSLTVNGVEVLAFTTYNGGYCETCSYEESGFRITDKKLAEKFDVKYYDPIATSHLYIEVT